MLKHTITLIALLWAGIACAAVYQPITNGQLTNGLNGNGQYINNLLSRQILSGTSPGSHAIDLSPHAYQTAESFGIGFGPDAAIYRSGTGTLTLRGSLIVTGSFPQSVRNAPFSDLTSHKRRYWIQPSVAWIHVCHPLANPIYPLRSAVE